MSENSTEALNKSEATVNAIINYITTNHLKPGDRLPSERELASMFGVSRPAVREAAFALSTIGIIETRQQAGMYLASVDKKTKLDSFRLQMQAGQFNRKDLYELRRVLEGECAALAARNITADQLATIVATMENVSIDDPEGFAQADLVLHRTIYAAAGNLPLQMMMETIGFWSTSNRQYTNSFLDVRKLVHYDHQSIFEAIAAHDPERSRKAMYRHIQNLEEIDEVSLTVLAQRYSQLLQNNTANT